MKKTKDFIIEMLIIASPLGVAYLVTGMWLSGITHNSDGASARMYGNIWVEFDKIFQGEFLSTTTYNFEVIQVFWCLVIASFSLVLVGKIGYVLIKQNLKKRVVNNG
ncbi:MAG: hypothetical protein E6778_16520 [Niallia nealsonii]|nr:hypothetical protein [Niallia nealsonii]